jgi:hypothetical protein
VLELVYRLRLERRAFGIESSSLSTPTTIYLDSSIGRALVSKTRGSRFDS